MERPVEILATGQTYLGAQHRRLAPRRGAKNAIIALARTILVNASYVLRRHQPYRDLRANEFVELVRQAAQGRPVRRLERLG